MAANQVFDTSCEARLFHRGGLTALACCVALWSTCLLSNSALAQGKKKPDSSPPQTDTLQTRDNVNVHITYYKSPEGKESPVIVLLHMKDGNRFVWQNGFAERLQSAGYAVITVDLRGHGESKSSAITLPGGNINQDADTKKKKSDKKPSSKSAGRPVESNELKPADYANMVVYDMEAVKKFIYDEHQAERLNMNKMGIVGPEMGAGVAANYALNDWLRTPHPDGPEGFETPRGQDVRALVLISPQSNFPGLGLSKSLAELRVPAWNIAFMVAVGKTDPQDKGQAKKLFTQASSFAKVGERTYFEEYKAKTRGTDLLGHGLKLEEHMMAFFEKHLKNFKSDWRDRRSKLEKRK